MANWILDWVIKLNLEPTPKCVLIILANRANKDRMTCYPSLFTIMQETGLSKSAVTNSMLKLERLGLLKRTPQFSKSGGRTTTLYQLLVPEEVRLLYRKKTGQVDATDKGWPGGNTKVVSEEDREPLREPKSEPKNVSIQCEEDFQGDHDEQGNQAAEVWRRIDAFLKTTMDKHRYQNWVGPLDLYAIDRFDEGHVRWRFSVPNEHFQEWWRDNENLILEAAKLAGFTEEIVCEFKPRRNS